MVAAAAAAVIYDHSSCSTPHPAEPTANDITQIKTLLHAFRITIAIMAIAARQRWQLALPTTRSSCGVCSQHPPTSLNLIVSAHILAITALCALGGAENAGRENAVHGTAGHHSRIEWMLSFFVLKMTTKAA